MRILLTLILLQVVAAFGQVDTIYAIRREYQGGEMVFRFWHHYIMEHEYDNGEVFHTVVVNVSSYKTELVGEDSTFTGVLVFCCEGSEYGRESFVRQVMYDHTCDCKQYNYYENGRLKVAEKRGDMFPGHVGTDRHIYESDSSDIYLFYDTSQILRSNKYVYESGDTTYTIVRNDKGEITYNSLEWWENRKSYDSIVLDRWKDHIEAGLLVNGYREGIWNFSYENNLNLKISYNLNEIIDIESNDLMYIGMQGEFITKEDFFRVLDSEALAEDREFIYSDIDHYIIPIPIKYSKRRRNKLLMLRLPSDEVQQPSNRDEEEQYFKSLLKLYRQQNK